ncbi:MAG TPA: hypothetical protein VMS08_01275 [Candidatus Saccharimonadia bacterium]|nr:hypothetical protein [Candidatus Saccharimonadia bacterium]
MTGRELVRATYREFRSHWKLYLLILGVVTIPSDILTLIFNLTTDAASSAYLSFAAIIMNAALIWSIVRVSKDGRPPSLSEAYYDGSAVLVKYIIVTFLVVLLLIPAAMGGALYAISVATVSASGVAGAELWLIGFVSLVIASPSAVLLVRFGMAAIAVIADDVKPLEAMRRTRRYTLGRFWKVTGRFLVLGLVLLALSIPITLVTALLTIIHLGSISTTFFEIATTLVALPVANIYTYRLYRNLSETYIERKVVPATPDIPSEDEPAEEPAALTSDTLADEPETDTLPDGPEGEESPA